MYLKQYELGCLSLFSYLIGDPTTGRAVVVDPQRDVSAYLDDAKAAGLTIERVIETHLHADFLSGHLELADATGASIWFGPSATTDFASRQFAHGDQVELGDVVLEIRSTPGHTPESISIVVWAHADDAEPHAVLTGDTLFIGDVGRPDLLASVGVTADDLARSLYRSVHDLMTLPDSTRVLPAHGAGSACGKNLSTATESTIGAERRTNYAVAPMSEDAFVQVVTEGQPTAPAYFAFAADANRRERDRLDDTEEPVQLALDEVRRIQANGGAVLDSRTAEAFAAGHLSGSMNVGLDGRFAEYAGDVVRPGQPIVLVTDPGREHEAKVRLARIGFDQVVGYLPSVERTLIDHPDLAEAANRLSAPDVVRWGELNEDLQIVDIRNPGEVVTGLLPQAVHVPLPELLDAIEAGRLDRTRPTVVYCAGGYRSSVGASALRSAGFDTVADLLGGVGAWEAAGLPLEHAAP